MAVSPTLLAQMPFWPGALMGLFLVGGIVLLLVSILIAVWVYRDAEACGMDGVVWVLVVLLANILGLIVYLIVRSDHPKGSGRSAPVCPSCGHGVDRSDRHCSQCGRALS